MAKRGGSRVDWHKDRVLLEVKDATRDLLMQLAFHVEGLAKRNVVDNDQVDTGFMLNSIYTSTPQNSNYTEAASAATNRAPDRIMGSEIRAPGDLTAVVACGASYGAEQEMRHSFLYASLEEAAHDGQAELIVEDIAKSRGLVQ